MEQFDNFTLLLRKLQWAAYEEVGTVSVTGQDIASK